MPLGAVVLLILYSQNTSMPLEGARFDFMIICDCAQNFDFDGNVVHYSPAPTRPGCQTKPYGHLGAEGEGLIQERASRFTQNNLLVLRGAPSTK
jgi:hypothetical protein